MAADPVLARVFVTGGQGFLGAYVLRDLLNRGSTVAVFDLKEDLDILRQVLSHEDIKRVSFQYGDIADGEAVKGAVLSFRPTAVIHLAGIQIPTVRANPALGASVNVTGTANVFEAVRLLAQKQQAKPVPVSYASSAAVLGPTSDYPNSGRGLPAELHIHRPRTLYGVYKLCCEGIARNFWQDHEVPSVALRPLTVFGVGREIGLTSGPTKAVKAAILGRRFELQVSGTTGFQYVSDVARLFCDVTTGMTRDLGAHVCGVRGHIVSCERFLDEAARVVPQVAELASIRPDAAEVPVHADVDETPLRALVDRENLHTPLAEAISDMARIYQDLRNRGHLRDNDLGPQPSKL